MNTTVTMKRNAQDDGLTISGEQVAEMAGEYEPEIKYSVQNVRHFIRQAEMQMDAAKELLDVLEEKMEHGKQATTDKWRPPHEGWAVGATYIADPQSIEANDSDARSNAILWPTREAALAQLARDIFFRRLCALAADLQGGKVGGGYSVGFIESEGWHIARGEGHSDEVFVSKATATRAAEIMNRDGWKMPAGLGGVE